MTGAGADGWAMPMFDKWDSDYEANDAARGLLVEEEKKDPNQLHQSFLRLHQIVCVCVCVSLIGRKARANGSTMGQNSLVGVREHILRLWKGDFRKIRV